MIVWIETQKYRVMALILNLTPWIFVSLKLVFTSFLLHTLFYYTHFLSHFNIIIWQEIHIQADLGSGKFEWAWKHDPSINQSVFGSIKNYHIAVHVALLARVKSWTRWILSLRNLTSTAWEWDSWCHFMHNELYSVKCVTGWRLISGMLAEW